MKRKTNDDDKKLDKLSDFPSSEGEDRRREATFSKGQGGSSEERTSLGGTEQSSVFAEDQALAEVLKTIEAVKADIIANKDKIAGTVMLCYWKDGATTHGWAGLFDSTILSGKLFNMAVDFSLHAAMQRPSVLSIPANELN